MPLDTICRMRVTIGSQCARVDASNEMIRPSV
jgi:hypothetical protein